MPFRLTRIERRILAALALILVLGLIGLAGMPRRLARTGRAATTDVGIHIDRARVERLLLDAYSSLP